MPDLIAAGYSKADPGVALFAVSIAYGISKFVMGTISDRRNARSFLTLVLLLPRFTMMSMGLLPFATLPLTARIFYW